MIRNLHSVLVYFDCYRINQTPSIGKSSYSLFLCCANPNKGNLSYSGRAKFLDQHFLACFKVEGSRDWHMKLNQETQRVLLLFSKPLQPGHSFQHSLEKVWEHLCQAQSECCGCRTSSLGTGRDGEAAGGLLWRCGAGPSADCFAALALVHSWPWSLCPPMPSMILTTWENPGDPHLWPGMFLALLVLCSDSMVTF